mgnify:FL=1
MTGFLDDLLTELIEKDIQQKKEAAYNTLKFIDERVDMVAKELGMVEQDLLNFRKKGRFLTSEAEFGYYQGRISESDKLLETWNLEIEILKMIQNYLNTDKLNQSMRTIPTNLSVTDAVFGGMILKYNELQIRKQTLAPTLTKDNDVINSINIQLKEIKENILTTSVNLIKAGELKIKAYNDRKNQDIGNLSQLPEKEKTNQEINRQRQTKEKLFLYLLQRKEETAISSISTASNYRKLDPAIASGKPLGTPDSQLQLVGLSIGFILPIFIIYLLDLFNNKINFNLIILFFYIYF